MPKKPIYQIYLKESLKKGHQYELEMDFSGSIWETTDGLFKGSYLDTNGKKMYDGLFDCEKMLIFFFFSIKSLGII